MRVRLSFLALAIALAGLATVPAGAEPSTFWTRQTGSNEQDVASGVAIDAVGNRYVVGQTTDGGDTDATVVSYDRYGNLRWEEDISTGGDDVAYAVAVSGQGVYVAGYTTGFVGDSGSNSGGQDAFIRRYDTSGNQVWSNHYGSAGNDRLFDIDVLDDGRLVAGGYTTGDLPEAVVGGTPSGGSDRLILVVDATTGAILDGIQDGTSSHDEARKIGISGCCTIYVSGYTFGDLEGTNGGSADAWATAYAWDAGTATLTDTGEGWQSGLAGSDSGRGIVAVEGTVYTAFAYDSAEGDRDILLVRWDGPLTSAPSFQPIGVPTHDETVDDLILVDDEPVIIGSSEGDLSGTNEDPGTADLVATRWIGGQTQDWWIQFGAAGDDYARSAAQGPDGGLTVVGTTEGSIGATNPNPGDLPANAGRDAVVRSFTAQRSDNPLPLAARTLITVEPDTSWAGLAVGASDMIYVAGNGGPGSSDRYFFEAYLLEEGFLQWTIEAEDPALRYIDIAVGERPGDPVVILGEFTGAGVGYLLRAHDPNTGNLLWLDVHGTAANDYPRALTVDETGAIFVTGYTAQSGTTLDTNVFITRHDPSDGDATWTTTFESGQFDTTNDIDADAGTVYVAGYTYGDLASPHAGDRDVFIGAFAASDGTQRWLRQEGGTEFEEALSIVAEDGSLLWSGYTGGSLFGPHAGQQDILVESLDPSTGTPRWSKQWGGADSERAEAITIDQWDIAHVSGGTTGDLFEPQRSPLLSESWIGSIDVAAGTTLAGEQIWYNRNLTLQDIDVAADGSVVVGGELSSSTASEGTWVQRRLVRPSALMPATIERHASALTVTWQPVLGGNITYTVDVDGETMCTTTTTSCLLTDLPADTDLTIEVVASNDLGSTGVQDTTSAMRTCDASLTHPFDDVPATSFADESVACILAIGVTTGTSATTYSPANFVTREQMAAFLARLYRYITATNCTDPPRFEDVPDTSFAAGDIGCIRALGITTGTSATTYSPANFVTREQMAAFLARLLRSITGSTCSGFEHPFDDVPDTSFASADVGCIYHHGITTGTSSTTYSPGNRVTREQMAAFLERLYQYLADPDRPAV